MGSKRFFAMFATVCTVVLFMSSCELFSKKSEPADILPAGTQVILQVNSPKLFWSAVPSNLRELLDKVAAMTKGLPEEARFDPEEIERKVKELLGFDPLSPAAYEQRGIDLDRPFTAALPTLELTGGVQVVVFVPVRNKTAFDKFIREISDRVLKKVNPHLKLEITEDSNVTSIKVDAREIIHYSHHKGYAILSYTKNTITWLISGDFKSLSQGEQFKKTMAPFEKGADAWAYLSPDLIVLAKSALGTVLKLSGSYMDKWISSDRGVAAASYFGDDKSKSVFHLPVPQDGYLSRIFSGSDDAGKLLAAMPPDAAVIMKELVNFKEIFAIVEESLVFSPKSRVKFEETVAEFEKEFGVRLKEDLLGHLKSGVLLAEYFRKVEEMEDLPKSIGFLMAVHVDGTPEAKKIYKTLMANMLKKEERKGVHREDFEDGSVLYSFETPGKEKFALHWGLVGDWLVLSSWRDLALAPQVQEPVSPNLAEAIAKIGAGAMFSDPSRHVAMSDISKAMPIYEGMASMPDTPPEAKAMIKMVSEFMGSFGPSWGEWGISEGYLWLSMEQKGNFAQLSQMSFAVIGVAAAIAIPNFIKFQAKARQSEAKTNLASITTAQIAYFAELNRWGTKFEQIGWSPIGETKYSYYLSCDMVIPSSVTKYSTCPPDLEEWYATHKTDPEGGFYAAAVGNIDSDSTLDIWIIDRRKTPENILNDINN